MIRLKSLLKEDETDDLKQILKNDYKTFVDKLGDNISDPKFISAVKSLSDKYPIQTSDISPRVKDLRPTQNEVVLDKSLSYPLTNATSAEQCLKGGVVAIAGKSIVTAGGGRYVIDGHHRWSQLFCMNPEAKIAALDITNIKNPIQALKATQLGIAAQTGKVPMSTGGGTNLFTIDEKTLKLYVINTITDPVVEVFRKNGKGSTKEEIANYIWENVKLLKRESKPIPGAPSREVMPQTDDAPQFKDTAVNVGKVREIKNRLKTLAGLVG